MIFSEKTLYIIQKLSFANPLRSLYSPLKALLVFLSMRVSISSLFGPQPKAADISFSFCEEVELLADWKESFRPTTALCGRVEIVRLRSDVLVFLRDATISGIVSCGRCLQEQEIDLSIPHAEQIFYSGRSEEWGEEEFVIDWKKSEIDLAPFLRQEIEVHIPSEFQHDENRCDPAMLRKIKEFGGPKKPAPLADLKKLLPRAPVNSQKGKGKKPIS